MTQTDKLIQEWLWSSATPIETTPRKTYLGRMMVVALAVCLFHAVWWTL